MKRFFTLLIASLLVGTGVFALFYLVFQWKITESFSVAVTTALTGFIVEYLRPYFIRLDHKQKEQISQRVRRGLQRVNRRSSE